MLKDAHTGYCLYIIPSTSTSLLMRRATQINNRDSNIATHAAYMYTSTHKKNLNMHTYIYIHIYILKYLRKKQKSAAARKKKGLKICAKKSINPPPPSIGQAKEKRAVKENIRGDRASEGRSGGWASGENFCVTYII